MDTAFDSRTTAVRPGNDLLQNKLGSNRVLDIDISFEDFYSGDGVISSIQNIEAAFCVKEVWTELSKYNESHEIYFGVLPFALADLHWQMPGARPPKGPDSFVLTYKIFEM